jgi:hypothetical protein
MKTVGYNRPLYILPFDHRGSLETKILGFSRAAAVMEIARRYREFAGIFENARPA